MNKHLKREPHKLKRTAGIWWYECPRGIEIHVEKSAIVPIWNQAIFEIDWLTLRNALKRKDKK